MAILSGNVIGNLRGRLGNLSARTVEGRTIMSARPSSFNVNYGPAVLDVRHKFSVTVDLAQAILSLDTLSAIWKTVKGAGMTVFNTIFKSNFAYSSTDRPTENNIITPGGFSLPVDVVTLDLTKMTASLLALSSEAAFTPDEVNVSANAVICFHDQVNPADPPYEVIALSKEIDGFNFDQPYNLQLDFDAKQKLVAEKYTKSIAYLIVASKNSSGKVIQYSATSPKVG